MSTAKHTANGAVPAELARDLAAARSAYDELLWADVQQAKRGLRVRDQARAELDTEQRAADLSTLPAAVTLADALLVPREGPKWRVDGLLHSGGNATLVAVQKAGKTTVVGNLIRSLVDGAPFLGEYDTERVDGRVALLNYEMEDQLQTEWLGALGVERTGHVVTFGFKGHRVPLLDRSGIEWMAGQLRAVEAEVAILDPFGAAYLSAGGTDMDTNNTLVGQFLRGLDELKRLSGVRELVIPAHAKRDTAEGAERARGPAMLGDWPEAIWVLTRDKQGRRFFRAGEGRDVDVSECQVVMDPDSKRLAIVGGNRTAARRTEVRDAVLAYVTDNPGCGKADVEVAVPAAAAHKRNDVRAALTELIGSTRVVQETGERGKHVLRVVTLAERREVGL